MINPQDTPEHRVAMNIYAMQNAIEDLLEMSGDKYGLPYIMRDSRYLADLRDDLGRLLMILHGVREVS